MSALSVADFHQLKAGEISEGHDVATSFDTVPQLSSPDSTRSSETSTPSNDIPVQNIRPINATGKGTNLVVPPPMLPRANTPVPFLFDFLTLAEAALERICKQLIKEVMRKDSRDNMTVMIIALPDGFHPSFGESLEILRKNEERQREMDLNNNSSEVTGVFESE
jgi:hypothetical protein